MRLISSIAESRGPSDPQRGFSLLEVLAAAAIALLLLGLALPGLAQIRSQNQRLTAAAEFQRIFWQGRTRALQQGVMVGIHFERTPDQNYHYQFFRDGNANGITAADRELGVDPPMTPRLRLFRDTEFRPQLPPSSAPAVPPDTGGFSASDAITLGGDTLSFSPLGTFSNGSIYLSNGREFLCVRFAGNIGRKRIYRWKQGQNSWLEVNS